MLVFLNYAKNYASTIYQSLSYIKYSQFEISRVPFCNHASAIAPQFLFLLLHIAFLRLLTTGLKRMRLKRDRNTIAYREAQRSLL